MKASDIKKNAVIRHRGQVCRVRNLQVQLPSSRGSNTLYKLRMTDVQTGQNLDHTFKGDDVLEEVDLVRRDSSYSYFDGELYVFMDDENYAQYSFGAEQIEDQLPWLSDGLTGIQILIVDDQPVAVQLPTSVVLEVTETAPAIKGGTVTKRTKPATLSTGAEVQVPEYLATGELIKVNTETGEFMSRA